MGGALPLISRRPHRTIDLLTGELTALLRLPRWDGKGEGVGFKWRGLEEERDWGKGEKGSKGLVGWTV